MTKGGGKVGGEMGGHMGRVGGAPVVVIPFLAAER